MLLGSSWIIHPLLGLDLSIRPTTPSTARTNVKEVVVSFIS